MTLFRTVTVTFIAGLLSAPTSAAPIKIIIASDSTAATFPASDTGSRWGWGQVLSSHFSANVIINNQAASEEFL